MIADDFDPAVEFERRCVAQGVDPAALRAAWASGNLDPDAGYDPDSPWFGKDVAGLTMFLPRRPTE
jgi:hypothetical protein